MKTLIDDLEDRSKLLDNSGVRNKTLLDIGAGPLAIISARDFNCHVTSIDLSSNALEEERKNAEKEGLSDRIKFEKQDAAALPYPDNSFDITISYGALHHTPLVKRENFLIETYRVAKQKVIIAEFNENGFPHSEDEHRRVDLNWLETELDLLFARVDKYQGKDMNVYVCFKFD